MTYQNVYYYSINLIMPQSQMWVLWAYHKRDVGAAYVQMGTRNVDYLRHHFATLVQRHCVLRGVSGCLDLLFTTEGMEEGDSLSLLQTIQWWRPFSMLIWHTRAMTSVSNYVHTVMHILSLPLTDSVFLERTPYVRHCFRPWGDQNKVVAFIEVTFL